MEGEKAQRHTRDPSCHSAKHRILPFVRPVIPLHRTLGGSSGGFRITAPIPLGQTAHLFSDIRLLSCGPSVGRVRPVIRGRVVLGRCVEDNAGLSTASSQ